MQQYTLDPKALLGGIIVEDNDQQIVQLALQKDNEIPPYQTDAIVLLIVLGGVSYKQAAVALNVPLGTLMSRLGRARAKLRDLMADVPTADLKGAS